MTQQFPLGIQPRETITHVHVMRTKAMLTAALAME